MRDRKLIVLVILFIGISIMIMTPHVQKVEGRIVLITEQLRFESMNQIMIFITGLGSYKVLFPFTIFISAIFIFQKKWIEPLFLFFNFYGVRYTNQMLKELFNRERPEFHRLIEIGEYSFPSGHAMNSLAIYGFILFLLMEKQQMNLFKRFIIVLVGLFIFLIGFSRIYVGVHYPFDVIGGFIIGSIWLLFVMKILQFIRQK